MCVIFLCPELLEEGHISEKKMACKNERVTLIESIKFYRRLFLTYVFLLFTPGFSIKFILEGVKNEK